MGAGNETPILLKFIFGEAAGLARPGASPRLLRWCQAMDDWLAERKRMYHIMTYRVSITAWKRLLSRCVKTPWELTPADIRRHIDWMQAQGYALSTIKQELSALSIFYKWCAQRKIDPACGEGFNPVAEVPRPKTVSYAKAKVLSRGEARALLAILKRDESIIGQRDCAFFLARLTLGVKFKTLQHLQWGQIERDETGVWLRWHPDQERTPCPPEVWDAVHAYLQASGRMLSIRQEDYIFAPLREPLKSEASGQAEDWNAGRCMARERFWANLKLYGKLVGIPEEKLTLHALRHTAVLLRQEAGDSLEQIQTFLGTEASSEVTKSYLRQLPALPADKLHPVDKDSPGDEQPPLPVRKPRSIPGVGITHGFYAQKQPAEEIKAVLAEDIRGMREEIIGLRTLSRRLIAAQPKAPTSKEAARLGNAYTQAAARIGEITKAERVREEVSEEDQWVDEVLTMLDNMWALPDAEADDKGELPSEEFWRTVAEGEPELQASSIRVTEEIAGTRAMLRRLYHLAMETEDVNELVRCTENYGMGCTRLARLLKEEKGAQGRAAVLLREMLDEAILEENKEWDLNLGS